jgi:(1->4)-alpha-D-glucan 1-alpha-D-glucosylmutase
MNDRHRDSNAPCANEEWLLYQTLVGAWPLDRRANASLHRRIEEYMRKAARESGERTSWLSPDNVYEESLGAFVRSILEDGGFLREFEPFRETVAWYGMLNSLSQLVLKIASPGVPDFYQGSELWDFSLVDPDNRRPVDFAGRERSLERQGCAPDRPALINDLCRNWQDGRIKLYITAQALATRQARARDFALGEYVPLRASGWSGEHIVAFARRRGRRWIVVAAPRFFTRLAPVGEWPVADVWNGARLKLPEGAPTAWTNVLSGEQVEATGSTSKALRLHEVFGVLPVSLLVT